MDTVALFTLDAEGDADPLTGNLLQLWRREGRGKLVPQLIPIPPTLDEVDDFTTGDVDGDGNVDTVLSSGA